MIGSDVFEERVHKTNGFINEAEWEQASILLKKTESFIKKSKNEEIKGWFFGKTAICNFKMAKKEHNLIQKYQYLKLADENAEKALSISKKLKDTETLVELYTLTANIANEKKIEYPIKSFVDSKVKEISEKYQTRKIFIPILFAVNIVLVFLLEDMIIEWGIIYTLAVFLGLIVLILSLRIVFSYFLRFWLYSRYYMAKFGHIGYKSYVHPRALRFANLYGLVVLIVALLRYSFFFEYQGEISYVPLSLLVIFPLIAYSEYVIYKQKQSPQDLESLNFKQNNEKEITNRRKVLALLETKNTKGDIYIENFWGLIETLSLRETYSNKQSSINESIVLQKRGIKLFKEKKMENKVLETYKLLCVSLYRLSQISPEPRSRLFLGQSFLIRCFSEGKVTKYPDLTPFTHGIIPGISGISSKDLLKNSFIGEKKNQIRYEFFNVLYGYIRDAYIGESMSEIDRYCIQNYLEKFKEIREKCEKISPILTICDSKTVPRIIFSYFPDLRNLEEAKNAFSGCKDTLPCSLYFAYTKIILSLLKLRSIKNAQNLRKQIQKMIPGIPFQEIPSDDEEIFFSKKFVDSIQDIVDLFEYFEKIEKKKRLFEKKEHISELLSNSELILSSKTLNEVEEFFIKSIIDNMRLISYKIFNEINEELKRFKEIPSSTYIAGPPVRDPSMFFGRNDIFDFIKRNLKGKYQNRFILIHGQKRVGKSSVLLQLKNRIGNKLVFVYLDMQGIVEGGDDILFYKFAKEIQRALAEESLNISIPEINEFQRAPSIIFEEKVMKKALEAIGSRSIVFMIDEFQILERRIKDGKSNKEILLFLRHLVQHTDRFSCILAGTHKIEELEIPEWAELLTVTLNKKIGVFERDEIEDLIKRPVREYNLVFSDEAIEEIYKATGGHPYLAQVVGLKLVEYHNDTRKNEFDRNDINLIMNDVMELANQYFVFLWIDSSNEEKLILISLEKLLRENSQADIDTLQKFLNSSEIIIDSKELDKTFRTLDYKELIDLTGPFLSFKSDLVRMWIEKNKPFEKHVKEVIVS